MSDMRLIVAGAGGRMGRTLVKAISETKGLVLAGATEGPNSPLIGKDAGELAGIGGNGVQITSDAATLFGQTDGIVDFTVPAATVAFAALAAKSGKVHVIGTTGLSAADDSKLADAAKTALIVKSCNMSLGVHLLAALTQRVAQTLDAAFDIAILAMNHNQKVAAPSGTALLLGQAAAEGRGVDLKSNAIMSREGHTGARKAGDIGFATLRGGTVVGEHTVMFAGPAERIELTH